MKLFTSNSKIEADVHQYEEGDVVIVRFEPDGNLSQNEYYEDTESKSRARRAKRSENWIWYAGVVDRVSKRGNILVKFFDDDHVTLSPQELSTEIKRITNKRLESVTGDEEYAGVITNAQAYEMIKKPLKNRSLEEVVELDDDSSDFESEFIHPISKMNPKSVTDVYEEYEWLGNWLMSPIYDAYKSKFVLPACIVGFASVRGKNCLILKSDISVDDPKVKETKFKTPWTVMEVYDRDINVTFEKLETFVNNSKSKVAKFDKKRVTLKELIDLRREAKKSKRFI